MSYELKWYAVEKVLRLDLENGLSLDEMKLANQRTVDILDKAEQKLTLLIDVSALAAGYTTPDNLRSTQSYRDHPKLDTIVIVANNKLNRLITLLAFHSSRARFIQFSSGEEAQRYIGAPPARQM
jgi:hypothetical protein